MGLTSRRLFIALTSWLPLEQHKHFSSTLIQTLCTQRELCQNKSTMKVSFQNYLFKVKTANTFFFGNLELFEISCDYFHKLFTCCGSSQWFSSSPALPASPTLPELSLWPSLNLRPWRSLNLRPWLTQTPKLLRTRGRLAPLAESEHELQFQNLFFHFVPLLLSEGILQIISTFLQGPRPQAQALTRS